MGAIAKQLDVAKSSVSLWTSSISLTKRQSEHLASKSKNAGRDAFTLAAHARSRSYAANTLLQQKLGAKDVTPLSVRDALMLGLGLYWGEGYKRGNRELGFTNSDPKANQFFIKWLRSSYCVETQFLTFRVSINSTHRNREPEIIAFWCKTLGVSANQFTKTSFVTAKQKRDYSGRGPHYGTLRIKLRGGSTLRARILSSIEAVGRNAK